MTNKHFNAILAKNEIARELGKYVCMPSQYEYDLPIPFLLERLKEIELFIGESNQPSVLDCYNHPRGV